MILSRSAPILYVAFFLFLPHAEICGQFQIDAKWIPDNANCLVLINAERIFSSEVAKKEGWATNDAFERGNSIVPPSVDKVLLASQVDFQFMETLWTTGLLSGAKSGISVSNFATRFDGSVESLEGRDAVVLPGDVYAVQIGDSMFGVMAPADRQGTVRWLRNSEAGRNRLSPYLSDALKFADENADIIIAFDMDNVISKAEARSRLLKYQDVRASDVDTIASAIEKMRGLTLGITIRDKIFGGLRIDFAPGVTGLDKIRRGVILEALGNQGVMIDDFTEWQATAEASRITLSGVLSSTGLRQINALVNHPIRGQFSDSKASQQGQALSAGKCTQQYIDSIDLYFRELDEFIKGDRHTNARSYARWFEKFADKIDHLSLNNVDSEALEFGANVSTGFRNIAQVLFSADATVASRAESEKEYGSYGYGYGYGYGYRNRSDSSVRTMVKKQEYSQAAIEAKEMMGELRNQLGNIRRAMAGKHSDF